MSDIAILVLAAGASARMRGDDKLLQKVDGVALLRRQVMAASNCNAEVLVALPAEAGARDEALRGLEYRSLRVVDAAEGMAASIRAGVEALADGVSGVMLLPADMPEIDADDLRAVISGFRGASERVVRGASADGRLGHPVVFPARLFAALRGLRGDLGAREVLRGEDVLAVPLPGEHALVDLDTPEEWAAWYAKAE